MADFDVSSMLAAASKGKLGAPPPAPAAPAAPASDAESSVIDVGGPSYSPAIPKGQQGSQVVVSPGQNGAAPPPDNTALTSPPPTFDVSAALHAASKGEYKSPQVQQGQTGEPSVPGAEPPAAGPAQPPMGWSDVPKVFTGSMAAALSAMPRGVLGDKIITTGNAALQTPFHMLAGMQGPSAAYNEALNEEKARTSALSNAYPIADFGGGLAGGFGAGYAAMPALGLRAATGVLPKVGAGLSLLARNAAFGSGMSELQGGDPMVGAGLGAAIPAAGLVARGVAAPVRGVYNKLSPLISSGGREMSVGNKLISDLGSGPTQIQTSPVGPLDLAQATGNAKIAGQVQIAKPYADQAETNLRAAQKQGIADWISKIGTPASTNDAAIETAGAVQKAQEAAKAHTNSLWNAPELKSVPVPLDGIKAHMDQAVASLEPGLRPGLTGNIKKALDLLHGMGDQETVGNLNSVRTSLNLASRPTAENPWASLVGNRLRNAFDDASHLTAAATPGVQEAWLAARGATREMKTAFGEGRIKPMLDKAKEESSTGAKIFDFSKGTPEGPQSIVDLSKYMASIPHGGPLAENIMEGARSQIAAAAQSAADKGNAAFQQFLRKNSAWLKSTGILDAPRIKALDELSEYTGMLRRPDELLAERGSSTQGRQVRDRNFIDHIISPWMTRGMAFGAGAFGHLHSGSAVEFGMVAEGAAEAFNVAVHKVEGIMANLKGQAVFDTPLAQALITKASPENRALLSPRTLRIIDGARAVIISEAAQLEAKASKGRNASNENKARLRMQQ